jgi:hypothetical protein
MKRYYRGKKIFLDPGRVHWHIALARNRPLTLNLVSGGSIHVANVRQFRS